MVDCERHKPTLLFPAFVLLLQTFLAADAGLRAVIVDGIAPSSGAFHQRIAHGRCARAVPVILSGYDVCELHRGIIRVMRTLGSGR